MVSLFWVCEFVFLWFWLESLFFIQAIFLGFSFLLLFFLLLHCIVLLEQSVCSFFTFFFEIRLIATLFLVLGWGCLSEWVQAGIYLSRLLTLEDGTDRLSGKIGKELPLLAAQKPRRAQFWCMFKQVKQRVRPEEMRIQNVAIVLPGPSVTVVTIRGKLRSYKPL